MKVHNIARQSFILFMGIFLLMVLFESQRFSLFFERESSKIPQLSIVGEYVEKISNATGISFATQAIGQITKDFSKEYIINDVKPINQQFLGFINQYTKYDFSKIDAWKKHKIADLGRFSDVIKGNSHSSPINNISNSDSAKSEQKKNANLGESSNKNQKKSPIVPKSGEIESALLNKSMTAAILAKQKAGLSAKQKGDSSPVFVRKDFALVLTNFFSAKQKNSFYDPRNSKPAPSSMALREYKSVLPDYGKKIKVLLVGDSMMMEGLGPTLHTTLRKNAGLRVVREGRYSSGLSRPDFYNWPENLVKLIDKHNPNLIIVSMGANDTQDIVINKNRHFVDSESWKRVYEIRTYNYLNIAAAEKRQVLWISLPVMGLEPYFTRTKRITKIQAQISSYFDNVTYVNIEHLLTKNDKFISFMKGKDNKSIRLRKRDHIHVSPEGGQILTNHILPKIIENIESIRFAEVDKVPLPPISGQANHVVLSSELRKKKTEYSIYLPNTLAKKNSNADKYVGNLVGIKNNPDRNSVGKNSEKESKTSEKASSIPALVKETMKSGDERFPVLYLLHGAYGSHKEWNKFMGKELQKIANEKRVIIVAPDAEPFGWYLDSPIVAQNQIESFVVKELVPHIDMLYPTNKKRAIAGLSMGGHGAMLLGFKYPKIFSSVASASGVLDIRLHQDQWQLKELLGNIDSNKNNWDKNSVVASIEKKQPKNVPKQILIVTGTEDELVLKDNRRAKDLLEKRQFVFEYAEVFGKHDWKFWSKYIPVQLRKQADFLHNMSPK